MAGQSTVLIGPQRDCRVRDSFRNCVCRWCSFGSAVAGTNAKITFYEYGEDGSVLHQTTTKMKVGAGRIYHYADAAMSCGMCDSIAS